MNVSALPSATQLTADTPRSITRAEEICQFVREKIDDLLHLRWQPMAHVKHYTDGHHCTVFEWEKHAGYIIKIMPPGQAEQSKKGIDQARRIIQENNYDKLIVPNAYSYSLGDKSILIMEKANGITNAEVCAEKAERIYEQYKKNPQLRRDWLRVFKQAAHFICKSGHSDICWKNNLIHNEYPALCFIDFEHECEPNEEAKSTGLASLLKLAPTEFYSDIYDIAEEEEYQPCFAAFKQKAPDLEKRDEELFTRSQFRGWIDSHPLSANHQIATGNEWLEDVEQTIVDQLTQSIASKFPQYENAPLELRTHDLTIEDSAPLESLQKKGIIHSFEKRDFGQYRIQF